MHKRSIILSSWEAIGYSLTQEFLRILWDPEFHYHLHKTPKLIAILSQTDTYDGSWFLKWLNLRFTVLYFGHYDAEQSKS
jgi:hypothetical protein